MYAKCMLKVQQNHRFAVITLFQLNGIFVMSDFSS